MVANDVIKSVTFAYCVDNLTKKCLENNNHDGLEYKKYLHDLRMINVDDDQVNCDICTDDFY